MEDILVRELTAEDADDISRIYTEIVQRPVEADFKRIIREHAARDKDVCFVATRQEKVVGFLISYILTMGFGIAKSAWIATLGVDPKFMGQGIGSMLAQETYACYRSIGIENVYTSVRWDTPDLLSFFKIQGFTRSNFINLRKVLT